MCECDLTKSINVETYKKIIHIIYEEHNNYTKQWIQKQINPYNLGKVCMCDICNVKNGVIISADFIKHIDSYKSELMSLYFDILGRIEKECNINIKGRIKNDDSIMLKIGKKAKQEDGKFPINKCLNDLLGFRIIDSEYGTNIAPLKVYLDDIIKNKKARIRQMKRNNGAYSAYHVYFRGENNYFFPVELQIWDKKDEKSNLASHVIYKKEYTSWPQDYKNTFERSD